MPPVRTHRAAIVHPHLHTISTTSTSRLPASRSKTRKRVSQSGAPLIRPPLNSFMIFRGDVHEEYDLAKVQVSMADHLRLQLSEDIHDKARVGQTDISRIAGQRWKKMSEEEKKPYCAAANAQSEVYKRVDPSFKIQAKRRQPEKGRKGQGKDGAAESVGYASAAPGPSSSSSELDEFLWARPPVYSLSEFSPLNSSDSDSFDGASNTWQPVYTPGASSPISSSNAISPEGHTEVEPRLPEWSEYYSPAPSPPSNLPLPDHPLQRLWEVPHPSTTLDPCLNPVSLSSWDPKRVRNEPLTDAELVDLMDRFNH